ncbi:hypothetical protein BDP55DRAFT_637099 [Colletotrichum godetiae]|uniref:Uncharacterized protein n=1 Tax=Colletotrichum godetiae TaxID=1209918 RepID=A0AAJ0ACQ7_9PEZI|nr:uncharacterized protein BDP55DRAFT_637099 [Colletotrichum godetiae]KAK1659216.1 hypothetical protein BDP55DRAFT_637099 [Colletotrichum godetiae]
MLLLAISSISLILLLHAGCAAFINWVDENDHDHGWRPPLVLLKLDWKPPANVEKEEKSTTKSENKDEYTPDYTSMMLNHFQKEKENGDFEGEDEHAPDYATLINDFFHKRGMETLRKKSA